jgi:RNA polymerase sigma-70 factor (ECF subfamily)
MRSRYVQPLKMKMNCNTETAYKKNKERLLSLIQSRIQNEEESKDVLQETFLQFEECCQKGCQCDYPKSYLFKIALNTIADFFKRKKKQKEMKQSINKPIDFFEEYVEFPCDVYECTYQFLSKLSVENQTAFIKSDIENIPQKKIAQELGIPISTLKSRVQRTRNYLKNEFEECLKKC